MAYTLDWDSAGANGTYTLNDGTKDVQVTISTTTNAAGQTASVQTFGSDSGLGVWGMTAPVTTTMTFDQPVSNINFWALDIDASADSWDDRLTILATDANGNQTPITYANLISSHVTGGTIDADSNFYGGVEGVGAEDSVNITIPGFFKSLTFVYENGDTYFRSGMFGLSKMTFDAQPVDGYVDGTAAGDLIDTTYQGDPQGDLIDAADAIGVGGTVGDADYVRAGAGDDTVVAGQGADIVYAGDGADLVSGNDGDDTVYGDAGNDTVFGGLGNDLANLGDGNDSFGSFNFESMGDDTAFGDAGDDFIIGGFGDDVVYGGIDNDTLSGGMGSDTLFGGDGSDNFGVTDDHDFDSIAGGEGGSDWDSVYFANLNSAQGIDIEFTATGAGTYDFLGTPTNGVFSEIEALGGTDFNDIMNAAADSSGIALYAGGGDDSVFGGSGTDTLFGGDGNDTLQGLAGQDALYAGAGADSLFGWDGNDTIFGGADADMVDGDAGNDLLIGDDGNDTLVGDAGNDAFYGGTGNDQVFDSQGNDTVYAGDGNDLVFIGVGDDLVEGGAGADSLYGGAGADTLTGGLDADRMDGGDDRDAFYGGSGDSVDGGEGGDDVDTLNVSDVFAIAFDPANGENGTITFIDSSTMAFSNIENIVVNGVPYEPSEVVDGTAGDDFMDIGYTDPQGDQIDGADGNDDAIYGYAGGDTIYGGAGQDLVYGGIGNDEVNGGDGNDSLVGEVGNDTLTGAAGRDLLYGGDDSDLLVASGGDVVYGGEGGSDVDTLSAHDVVGIAYDPANSENGTLTFTDGSTTNFFDIEQVVLNGGNPDGLVMGTSAGEYIGAGYVDNNGDVIDNGDAVYAGAGPDDDDVFAGEGNDTILSGAGKDNVYAGTGSDLVYTGDGNDYGQGNEDSDTLYGGLGDDFLRGDAGNDSVFGGLGNDTNYGGLGQDYIDTGDGDDVAFGGYGNDTVNGGAGNDTLTGSGGSDAVYGGTGDDSIQGAIGDDTLYGGEGADLLFGEDDSDVIYGGVADQVDGGETGLVDNDTLFVTDVASISWEPLNSENGVITFNGGGTLSFTGIENLYVDGVAMARPDGTVSGTVGNDLIDLAYTGDPDGDRIDANDASLNGAAPNDDLVLAGAGNDTVLAEQGADKVFGGAGDDSLMGGDGNDTLYGDIGADNLLGDAGNDLLYGGIGNDTLLGGTGSDTMQGGLGADSFDGGSGLDYVDYSDSSVGVSVNLEAGVGAYGSAEGDVYAGSDGIYGSAFNDTLIGYDAQSQSGGDIFTNDIYGGSGNDSIDGRGGDDSLYGGIGNDTLIGGAGADSIVGGEDRDVIFGGIGDSIDGGEAGNDYDTLNLSSYGKAQTHILYGGGNNEAGTVEFLDATGAVTGTLAFQNIEHVVPCFTPGILIQTDRGEVKVEDLAVGDRVLTRDHGLQPIRWLGQRRMTRFDLIKQPKLNPIRIRAGALGNNLPHRDMVVSPQHRMLISGARAEMFFAVSEVLVAATHLVGETGVERIYPNGVTYIHVMFDLHQIIRADGAWTESFQPGDATLAGMVAAQRDELFAIFPELEGFGIEYPSARPTLKAHEARVMLSH